jgi:hypothetical protein
LLYRTLKILCYWYTLVVIFFCYQNNEIAVIWTPNHGRLWPIEQTRPRRRLRSRALPRDERAGVSTQTNETTYGVAVAACTTISRNTTILSTLTYLAVITECGINTSLSFKTCYFEVLDKQLCTTLFKTEFLWHFLFKGFWKHMNRKKCRNSMSWHAKSIGMENTGISCRKHLIAPQEKRRKFL